jgi:hypothetical protein
MNDELLLMFHPAVYIATGVFFGAVGAYLAEKRGRTHYKGFLVGFFFGLLGVLSLVIFLENKNTPTAEN